MYNKKVPGNLPIIRQNPTQSPTNSEVVSAPEFVRSTPAIQTPYVPPTPASSIAPQTTSKIVRTPERPGWYASGKVNVSDQLRLAISNGGPDYTYDMYIHNPLANVGEVPARRLANFVKGEFAFGMSATERMNLFRAIKRDISNNDNTKKIYGPDAFINPDAVKAMRQQAVIWNQIPGNNISTVRPNDAAIRDFFRELALSIPVEHRQAALAMIEHPPEYRQPLAGTRSERIATSQPLPGNISQSAFNPTLPNAQAQQGIYAPNTGASSYPAMPNAPSMVGKRSFTTANIGQASADEPSQIFKRSRFDSVDPALPLSSSYDPRSFSFSAIPSHTVQPTAQYQPPPMPQATNSWAPSYQDDIFLGGPPFDTPPLQQAQPQIQSRIQPSHTSGITTFQANALPGGQSFDISQSQPPLQPQTQPVYNSGTAIYQPQLFQGGPLVAPAQSQPSSSWSASNRTTQPDVQSQFQPQQMQPMQPVYNQWASNYPVNVLQGGQYFDHSLYQPTLLMPVQAPQFDQGGALAAPDTNTNGLSFGGQPNYGVAAGASASSGPGGADAEWLQLMNMIDYLAPITPATTVTGQTTSAPVNVTPTNQPATNG